MTTGYVAASLALALLPPRRGGVAGARGAPGGVTGIRGAPSGRVFAGGRCADGTRNRDFGTAARYLDGGGDCGGFGPHCGGGYGGCFGVGGGGDRERDLLLGAGGGGGGTFATAASLATAGFGAAAPFGAAKRACALGNSGTVKAAITPAPPGYH